MEHLLIPLTWLVMLAFFANMFHYEQEHPHSYGSLVLYISALVFSGSHILLPVGT